MHVVHVGRRGDVPGGMTQVVNGFLEASIEGVTQRLLVTRTARPLSTVVAWLRALGSLVRLPRPARSRTVLAVHLSQGGSFLREGSVLLLARRLGVGTVAHLHGSSFARFSMRHPRLARTVLGAADRVLVLSAETEAAAGALVASERIERCRNAVAPPAAAVPKQRVVVFAGAVGRRKGVDVLLRAWGSIGDHRGWRLLIAGPVREPDVLAHVPPDVTVLGPLRHGQVLDLLDKSGVAVLPSRAEAMPVFLLEAIARRNAVIASPVGGVREVFDGTDAALVPPGDSDALAAELERLLDDDDARVAAGEALHEHYLRHYSTDVVHPQVAQVWREALDARR